MYTLAGSSLLAWAVFTAGAVATAPYAHVLVFSIDGMHGSDVTKYVAKRPNSNIATLLKTGHEYTNAFTSAPSDSFPGSVAQYTGASPRTTGVWYDDVWDRSFYAPGSNCTGPIGAEVEYAENLDYNSTLVWSGGIDPANLPMKIVSGVCKSIAPHQRLRVNTVWEIAAAAGLVTAYTDKHPSYDIMRGPSGTGLTVGYFPEIQAIPVEVNTTIQYDQMHVDAWLDWIDGITPVNSTIYDVAAASLTGTRLNETTTFSAKAPSLFGGNFQAVSVAQKTIGYNNDSSLTPGLLKAMDFVDNSLGKIVKKLQSKKLYNQTLIIVASKHGQAPIDPKLWNEVDPDALTNLTGVPTQWITTDDIGLIFLNHTSDLAAAVANLKSNASVLKIDELIYGANLTAMGFGNPATDPAVPDIIVRPDLGTCYTTSGAKIAEHGGLSDDDRHVALFLSNPHLKKKVVTGMVSTRQVAPTILRALGLNVTHLQGAVKEGTKALETFM